MSCGCSFGYSEIFPYHVCEQIVFWDLPRISSTHLVSRNVKLISPSNLLCTLSFVLLECWNLPWSFAILTLMMWACNFSAVVACRAKFTGEFHEALKGFELFKYSFVEGSSNRGSNSAEIFFLCVENRDTTNCVKNGISFTDSTSHIWAPFQPQECIVFLRWQHCAVSSWTQSCVLEHRSKISADHFRLSRHWYYFCCSC